MREWAIGLICFLIVSIVGITWFSNSEVYRLAVGTVERLNDSQDKINRTLDTLNATLKTVQRTASKIDRSTDLVGETVVKMNKSMTKAVGSIQKDIDRIDNFSPIVQRIVGGHSMRETPVPIPNTEAKAHTPMVVRERESRSLPTFIKALW